MIKFSAWESVLKDQIMKLRVRELKYIRYSFILRAFSDAIVSLLPIFLGVTTFPLYDIVYPNDPLDISSIMVLLAIYNQLLTPIVLFVLALATQASAKASSSRIEIISRLEKYPLLEESPDMKKGQLKIEKATFQWESMAEYESLFPTKKLDKTPVAALVDIEMEIKSGEVLGVVGKVGSGKTALVLAMMDEMVRKTGKVQKNGKIAFIQQEAFLLNETIKNNITFGLPYEEEKFRNVIKICQLESDLDQFDAREETEIGEKGINLSGGQKQRVSIARAVYSNADIYLIDDALSALDAHVGKKILEDVFLGYLNGKTIVITTNNLQVLEYVDRMALMVEGRIAILDTFENGKKDPKYQEFSRVENNPKNEDEEDTENKNQTLDKNGILMNTFANEKGLAIQNSKAKNIDIKKPRKLNKKVTFKDLEEEFASEYDINSENHFRPPIDYYVSPQISENNEISENNKEQQMTNRLNKEEAPLINSKKQTGDSTGKLTVEERRFTGQVGLTTYYFYFKSASMAIFVCYILANIITMITQIISNWWITRWSRDEFDLPNSSYMLVYVLIGSLIFVELLFVGLFVCLISVNASYNIFSTMVWSVLRRPMKFFDTNPSGVVLNRFTGDIAEIDSKVPFLFQLFFSMFLRVVLIFVLASILSPPIIILVIIGGTIGIYSCSRYLKTSTEIKRLNQLSISPVISIASELMSGVTTIRNYGQIENTMAKYAEKADVQHCGDFHEMIASIWVRSRLEYTFKIILIFSMIMVVVNQKIFT